MNRYDALIEAIFFKHYSRGTNAFPFKREELSDQAKVLGITLPKNLGDIIYSIRYRTGLPLSILSTVTDKEKEWIIVGSGKGLYEFKLVSKVSIAPREALLPIKIPDATPEIIRNNALGDEQALLAIIRYNRLIDIFLGIVSFSLQNHLRTTVKSLGQIEIDEIYVGIDRQGRQFVIPVQAKGGKDKHGVVQTHQDILCCEEKFPTLLCRPISAQFMKADKIAIFELTVVDGEIKVVEERHYQLVKANEISPEELAHYNVRH